MDDALYLEKARVFRMIEAIPSMKKSRALQEKWIVLSFIGAAAIILLVITVYPFLFALYTSFHTWMLTKPETGTPFVGLFQYKNLLFSSVFQHSLGITLIFVFMSVGGTFLIGLCLALVLSREDIGGKSIFRTILIIPYFLTPVVVGFAFRFMYDAKVGLIPYFLSLVGIHLDTILGNPSIALYAVIAVDIWNQTPLAFLILLAGFQAIPLELYEVAKVDGASSWQTFRYITLPLLKYAISLVLLIRTIEAFKMFDVLYVMTEGGPGRSTELLNMLGYKLAFSFFRMGGASAFSILVFCIVMGISYFYIKFIMTAER